MKNTIKHIVTIEDSLNEEYKHLVEINNKLVVFEFDKYDILKHIEHSNTYSFANMLTPIKFFEWFKNSSQSDLDLGLYESFNSKKLTNDYYYNLYELDLKHKKLWNKFNTTLNILENEIKENTIVLHYKRKI